MADLTQDRVTEEIKTSSSKRSKITLEIAGAALFSALSIVVGALLTPTLTQLLRIPGWFIAIIDLISLIWVACFYLFGARAGLLCCIVGTIGLMPFDPSAPVGPLMKLAATVSLIIVPIIFLKLYKREPGVRGSQKLKKPKNFVIYGVLGTLLRIVVMVLLNVLVFLTVYSSYVDYISLAFLGLPEVTGLTAVIIGAPLINAWQSGLDLIIPYIIIFGGKLDQQFEIW
jgi:riboflavin transporter FmnP